MVVVRCARGGFAGHWRCRQNFGRVVWMACSTWWTTSDGTARQGRARPLVELRGSGQRVASSGGSWGVCGVGKGSLLNRLSVGVGWGLRVGRKSL